MESWELGQKEDKELEKKTIMEEMTIIEKLNKELQLMLEPDESNPTDTY